MEYFYRIMGCSLWFFTMAEGNPQPEALKIGRSEHHLFQSLGFHQCQV